MTYVKKILMSLFLVAAFILFFAEHAVASVVSEMERLFIRVILENRIECDDMGVCPITNWICEINGDGAIEEISACDYFDKIPAEDGLDQFSDMPATDGTVEFYFKGVRPGMVDLRITCVTPGRDSPLVEAKFSVSVLSDMKIEVLESSVKYDWTSRL